MVLVPLRLVEAMRYSLDRRLALFLISRFSAFTASFDFLRRATEGFS